MFEYMLRNGVVQDLTPRRIVLVNVVVATLYMTTCDLLASVLKNCSIGSLSILTPSSAVANESCDPFTSRELPCEPGPSVTYSVNATCSKDFVKAISFARRKNIRLVIRNTGHE